MNVDLNVIFLYIYIYINIHWTYHWTSLNIQFHPYSEKRTEVSPSIESVGIWSMICLADLPPFFSLRGLAGARQPWATRGPWKSAQHGALHFGSGSPFSGQRKSPEIFTPVATWGLKAAATIYDYKWEVFDTEGSESLDPMYWRLHRKCDML